MAARASMRCAPGSMCVRVDGPGRCGDQGAALAAGTSGPVLGGCATGIGSYDMLLADVRAVLLASAPRSPVASRPNRPGEGPITVLVPLTLPSASYMCTTPTHAFQPSHWASAVAGRWPPSACCLIRSPFIVPQKGAGRKQGHALHVQACRLLLTHIPTHTHMHKPTCHQVTPSAHTHSPRCHAARHQPGPSRPSSTHMSPL